MILTDYQPAAQRGEHPLAEELRTIITTTEATKPRSLQTAIGPSELGEPCLRRLAYKLMSEPTANTNIDPWAAIIGTSVHTWLADAFTAANQRLGRIRYLIETHLTVRAGLEGTCDLYDADRATVIDHKVIGSTNLRNYRINGPSEQYRVQAHAYGMAYTQLGLPVTHVALAFYPRSSDLSNLHVWTQPYDPNVVIAALDRHDTLIDLICALDVEHAPDRYRLIPATPSHRCGWCPWFKPGPDTGATCPGATNVTAPAA